MVFASSASQPMGDTGRKFSVKTHFWCGLDHTQHLCGLVRMIVRLGMRGQRARTKVGPTDCGGASAGAASVRE